MSLIPNNRENLSNKRFSQELEHRRAYKKLSQDVLYSKLKYKIIKFCTTWGMGIAILLWIISVTFNQEKIESACLSYIRTIITLIIGALISKTL